MMSIVTLGSTVQAQSLMDVITLAKFSDYTPGANKWFTDMSFGSDAAYSGHVKVANDESGMVFEKKSDAFYVTKPIDDARVKSISITFLTDGEVEVYLSNTRQLSMSGGTDVMKQTISSSSPMLTFTDDYKYFIFRNPDNEFIISMITIVWESKGLAANVEAPTLYVDGVEYDASIPLDLEGTPKHITLSHSDPDATIYYLWEPDTNPGLPLFTPYTDEIVLTKTGTLSFNSEVGGQESDVIELKVIGEEVVEDSITETYTATSAEAEWYNLQGQKVENPANGIFILRSGNKTQKVKK